MTEHTPSIWRNCQLERVLLIWVCVWPVETRSVLVKLKYLTVFYRLVTETLVFISLSLSLSLSLFTARFSLTYQADEVSPGPARSSHAPASLGITPELIPVQAQILKDGIYWTQALVMWHINHERCSLSSARENIRVYKLTTETSEWQWQHTHTHTHWYLLALVLYCMWCVKYSSGLVRSL